MYNFHQFIQILESNFNGNRFSFIIGDEVSTKSLLMVDLIAEADCIKFSLISMDLNHSNNCIFSESCVSAEYLKSHVRFIA